MALKEKDTEMVVFGTGKSVEAIKETFKELVEKADVSNVYAKPVKHGDTLLIPAAEVMAGVGFGLGQGYGQAGETDESAENTGGGEGGGGGGRMLSRPVAIVIASETGVRIEPVIDQSKIWMAAITAGGFMAALLLRLVNPRWALRQLKK
jgi:uncharacterized spore protein YtfJ